MHARAVKALALAVAIAAPAEGLRQWAYHDPVGILTICYGDTENVRRGQYATLEECAKRLDARMLEAIADVEKCAPGLPEHQLAAFADLTYNVGARAVCNTKTSTLARKLKAGDVLGACNELPRWSMAGSVRLPGLVKRRERERQLCITGKT